MINNICFFFVLSIFVYLYKNIFPYKSKLRKLIVNIELKKGILRVFFTVFLQRKSVLLHLQRTLGLLSGDVNVFAVPLHEMI